MDRRMFLGMTTVGIATPSIPGQKQQWMPFTERMPAINENIAIKRKGWEIESVYLININDVEEYLKEDVVRRCDRKKIPFLCRHEKDRKLIIGNKEDWTWRSVT